MNSYIALLFLIVSSIHGLMNTTLHRRQDYQSIQQIAIGLVAPIHVALVPMTGKVVFLERVNGGEAGTTHTQEFDVASGFSRPLNFGTDAFCSAGFIDTNGRLINVGGWDGPALEAVRVYAPCGSPGKFGQCDWFENLNVAALKVPRWYPSALPLASGRIAVIGGTTAATGLEPPAFNQPNIELIPPRLAEMVINVPLLVETDTYNLYPIAHFLPTNQVFLMAGERSQLLDPDTFQALYELPPIVGKRTYPFAGGSVMLTLRPSQNYLADILVCGGGTNTLKDAPALDTCGRIFPTLVNAAWQMEIMPTPRLMPDLVLLPDGTVFITNGVAQGWGGFDNAQNPIFTSFIYNPIAPLGQRFSIGGTSNIARMYHSEALLLEDGRVLICGSTPNADANAVNTLYPNEKRIEVFIPPYLVSGLPRPVFTLGVNAWDYQKNFLATATIPSGRLQTLKAVLFTNGFVTHSVHMGQRMVELTIGATRLGQNRFSLTVQAPPSPQIAPPGWYMLFILDGPTPSIAQWIRIGNMNELQNWI